MNTAAIRDKTASSKNIISVADMSQKVRNKFCASVYSFLLGSPETRQIASPKEYSRELVTESRSKNESTL